MGNIRKCSFCGKEKHYAKGLCKNCYTRYIKRGTVEYYVGLSKEERLIKSRENSNTYRKKHPEEVAITKAKWEKRNKERRKEYKRQWYLKNRERILEKIRLQKIDKMEVK
jgi:hypothetical protein